MRELSFMGPSNDGKRLLLVAEDGTQFELPVDSRLVAVVSREHGTSTARPTPAKAIAMPTPREIQEQIRHGGTIEEIAERASVNAEDIAKFAHPVITERAHVAQTARNSLVTVAGEPIPLDDAVLRRIQPRAVDPQLVRWDAWRSEGSTWTVVAAYPASQGERTATFAFSVTDRSVTPVDDGARWILEVGEVARPPADSRSTGPQAVGQNGSDVQRPRPHAVPNMTSPAPSDTGAESLASAAPAKTATTASPALQDQARSWDRAHPAARAHQRREANAEQANAEQSDAARSDAGRGSEHESHGQDQRVNPEHPAAMANQAPSAPPTPSKPEPKEETPQWEELLFGSPLHDDPQ